MTFDSHYIHFQFYAHLGAWFYAHLVILSFHMALDIFSIMLRTKWGLPHLANLGLTHCICGHPINLMGIHIFYSFYKRECTTSYNYC
jgi:hypothetical protein